MKKIKPAVIVLTAALVVALGGIFALGFLYQSTAENATSLYSRIDNTQVEEITPHGGMQYRYTLQAYAEDGTGQELVLDTSRILKDGAYIRVEVAALRGVISWEEVQPAELPAPVQTHMK